MTKKKTNEEEIPLEEREEPAQAVQNPEEAVIQALAAEKDRFVRLAAEYDNYRKRSARERDAAYSDAVADTAARLLPVYDNLDRALKQPCTDEAFHKGVELTAAALKDIFASLGLKEIEAVGQAFDPSLHNAVMHTESPDAGSGVITEEFQKGFTLGERVIRFSMVAVAN